MRRHGARLGEPTAAPRPAPAGLGPRGLDAFATRVTLTEHSER